MLKGTSFYDTKDYCCKCGQFILKTKVLYQKNGKPMCPYHHTPVRLSANTARYKRRIDQQ